MQGVNWAFEMTSGWCSQRSSPVHLAAHSLLDRRWINTCTGETFPLKLQRFAEARLQGAGAIFTLKCQRVDAHARSHSSNNFIGMNYRCTEIIFLQNHTVSVERLQRFFIYSRYKNSTYPRWYCRILWRKAGFLVPQSIYCLVIFCFSLEFCPEKEKVRLDLFDFRLFIESLLDVFIFTQCSLNRCTADKLWKYPLLC